MTEADDIQHAEQTYRLTRAFTQAKVILAGTAVVALSLVLTIGSFTPTAGNDQSGVTVTAISMIGLLAAGTYAQQLRSELRRHLRLIPATNR